jgi:hypothetical protein
VALANHVKWFAAKCHRRFAAVNEKDGPRRRKLDSRAGGKRKSCVVIAKEPTLSADTAERMGCPQDSMYSRNQMQKRFELGGKTQRLRSFAPTIRARRMTNIFLGGLTMRTPTRPLALGVIQSEGAINSCGRGDEGGAERARRRLPGSRRRSTSREWRRVAGGHRRCRDSKDRSLE